MTVDSQKSHDNDINQIKLLVSEEETLVTGSRDTNLCVRAALTEVLVASLELEKRTDQEREDIRGNVHFQEFIELE